MMIEDAARRSLLLGGGLALSGLSLSSVLRAGTIDKSDDGIQTTARSLDADGVSITSFGARAGGLDDTSPAFNAAFASLSGDRTSPPGLAGWGVGAVTSPRGAWMHRSPLVFSASQLGFTMRGEAAYATAHLFDIAVGSAVPLKTYVATTLSDFYLRNVAAASGNSVGIGLDPVGGGGLLTIKRVAIDGFRTALKVNGTENGDKTLVEQVSFGTPIGFDNGRNKQAVGWTFLNCAGACGQTHFRLGGAGEIAIVNYVGNVHGSLIELPEASGNAGALNQPARVTLSSTKLEYHGERDRLLIDARQSLRLTDEGGSNADIVLREVSLASGATPPDPKAHVVIQVGDAQAGSDAVRVKQEGGWIEGIVRYGSKQPGTVNRRWSFRDALRAPDPATVELLGRGNHPLMEWRANENVPVDQYRGGQAFTGAIDAQKAFLWRHIGPYLINTGLDAERIDGRVGFHFAIGEFPLGTTQLGLAVYLDEPLAAGHDLEIAQFTDATFRTAVGAALTVPAGSLKGLSRIHDRWTNLIDGRVHVRVTMARSGLLVRGAIVPFYFPYMGS